MWIQSLYVRFVGTLYLVFVFCVILFKKEWICRWQIYRAVSEISSFLFGVNIGWDRESKLMKTTWFPKRESQHILLVECALSVIYVIYVRSAQWSWTLDDVKHLHFVCFHYNSMFCLFTHSYVHSVVYKYNVQRTHEFVWFK